ncbi:acetyl-CoA carboxylase carboxyltransferase subunit alpha [Reyranella sp.]|jgi:acetyl-CoA carboxylase carboxyl transferase subunit alpha|uniref:acetyl-CoA carboxylase carboxyltransferase subunit alpha n=1 Tax=Reyranella sp. TaxID=1929291 RepID=UPI000BC8A3D7|nr:acetyl-CoA carboxylase carboxyltransferase subunit alpha [Reyranella sp.]OYY35185.1 MAG: acetyl-CoA carboxylase carboxyl transferase subunit alpha [Rhodospirillales bacterium 35-66-84]OYZ91234.1 MAG: acetyl-CoA carboxylase carboxyl transferase subunit alpha [Rhodospirillales bacterium 24-66-33]OZB21927.1 MAG: acetyl-CoA carboxylase carboxyl transferase subunit alpha [Rhodospirillales bacterium 39-66-50]HQS19015.1 acetyl-CoA carboxylase carboxyltransferase subunit alpha [Reyranella sp.]HQT15
MTIYLDFEKPIAELEGKIAELRHLPNSGDVDIAEEVMRLQEKAHKQIRATYAKLTPWQRVQVARHAERPHAQAYIDRLITDYTPLAGDRAFGEDAAIVGGMGRLQGRSIVVLGQQKGDDTDSRIKHNFGMARPEGYRKAQRLMRLADRFKLPVLTLVDTPGAYPGIDAEARGQAEAIASSIETCLGLGVPLVSVVIGEGGSGGALAIASADRVYMLENSVYSVITPEGCASILWRNNANAQDAAEAMKVTAADLRKLEVIDDVIPEPMGGAHRAPDETIDVVGKVVAEAIADLSKLDADTLRERRQDKFLAMGKKGL